jgi:hypothetical protein
MKGRWTGSHPDKKQLTWRVRLGRLMMLVGAFEVLAGSLLLM